jgi:diguanylate cyclase
MTPRYSQTPPQAAELLRMVLSQLAQHGAACNPHAFAVWYEHLAGINPRLSAEMDETLRDEPRLTDASMARLYQRHVALVDEATAERVRTDMARVMGELSASANRTGDSASDFGQRLSRLNESLESADAPALRAQMAEALAGTQQIRSSVAALSQQVASSQREITALRDELARTREDAARCPLTRVLNRKGFDAGLEGLVSGRAGSLVMVDIDHFKRINDEHGHLFGDRVLAALGEVLQRCVASLPQACAARYGGEEFALLLPGASAADAERCALLLCAAVRQLKVRQRNTDHVVLTVTVSCGVAALGGQDDGAALIERADAALYRAKQGGRDRVCVA